MPLRVSEFGIRAAAETYNRALDTIVARRVAGRSDTGDGWDAFTKGSNRPPEDVVGLKILPCAPERENLASNTIARDSGRTVECEHSTSRPFGEEAMAHLDKRSEKRRCERLLQELPRRLAITRQTVSPVGLNIVPVLI
jgi:hypothetical protein